MKVDIFKYAGQVTMTGYEMLCEQIGSVKGNGSERALLIIERQVVIRMRGFE